MKIYVLGHTGMLGRYIFTYFKSKGYEVEGWNRKDMDISKSEYSEAQLRAILFHRGLNSGDIVINCMGTIKPMVDKFGTLNAIKVNSLFPHLLANICENEGYKMLHITTDCVFSGKKGMYNEDDLHDCTDVYGKTKSLGEPTNCTVIRTSIIGEEIGQTRSLVEWIKSSKDKTVNGFVNHNWNGLTCLQIAKVFENIITKNKFWSSVRHVPSPNTVNKWELVTTISDVYGLNITVNKVEDKNPIDRTMVSKYDMDFNLPTIQEQIQEMKDFYPTLVVN